MGLDYSYRTIPRDSPIVEFSKTRASWGFYLEHCGFSEFSDDTIADRCEDPDFVLYAELTAEARRTNPGIETRTLEIYRHWDMLHYLLSDNRRRCLPEDSDDMAKLAVTGGPIIGENVVAGQGVPLHYLSPDKVTEVLSWLLDLPKDVLEKHWDPPAMCEAGVYKMHPTDGEEDLDALKDDFENLCNFYTLASAYDEGVIAICG